MSVSSKPRSTGCRSPVLARLVAGLRAVDPRAQLGRQPQVGVTARARSKRACGSPSAGSRQPPRSFGSVAGPVTARTGRRARSRAADRPTRRTGRCRRSRPASRPFCTNRRIAAACASDSAPTFGRISSLRHPRCRLDIVDVDRQVGNPRAHERVHETGVRRVDALRRRRRGRRSRCCAATRPRPRSPPACG